jgi:uncharacterized protein (TIGR02328 family)
MRIWDFRLLPYLPDAQFRGQLRELVAIMHDWRDVGHTNHLLINRVMDYPKSELYTYFLLYQCLYYQRYEKPINKKYEKEFDEFANGEYMSPEEVVNNGLFNNWHNKKYLRVCLSNLYEKHFFGVGKSHITRDEWNRLLDGYKAITGEDYTI